MASRGQRFQLRLSAALVFGSGALLALRCSFAPEIEFVVQDPAAPWITDPRPVFTLIKQWGRAEVPLASFVRRFDLPRVPAAARLELRAHRSFRVSLNGAAVEALSAAPDSARRGARADVAGWLRAGPNELRIDVANSRGPPLLWARLELPSGLLATGPAWQVSVNGAEPAAAVAADDVRRHPSAAGQPSTLRALARLAPWLLGIALLSVPAALALETPRLRRLRPRLPALALATAHAAWAWVFLARVIEIPLWMGFDALFHLEYVRFLLEERALPHATDGWSMYHPPLFYALAAAATEAGGALASERGAMLAVKALSFLCGLGTLWLSYALGRLLLPGRPGLVALAVLFTAALPLNLYMAAYVSNEPLHALLFGLATWAMVRATLRGPLQTRDALLVGGLLGLALLAKLTALLLAVSAAALAAYAILCIERAGVARAGARILAMLLPAVAVAGWFYVRGFLHYGRFVLGNWNLPGDGNTWWSHPGFHTPAYYLGFGEVLVRPFFSGFRSFWDALYSTFWGDGWVAAQPLVPMRHDQWNYDFMSVGYLLALPATALLFAGGARALREAFRGEDPRQRAAWWFLLTLIYLMGYALLSLTVELPYFGQARASYALALISPIAVLFALGADACDAALGRRGWHRARLAARAWLVACLVVLYLGFAA